MSKLILRAVALAAAFVPPLAAAAPLSLSQALDLAVQRSEVARAARAGVAGATEAARASGQLPDPILRAGIENLPIAGPDRLSTTRDFQTMKRIGISQEWLSPEKRAARKAAARALTGREMVTEQTAAAEARMQTALAYLDAYFAGEALKLTTLNEKHVREQLEAGKGRMATTSGNSAEVLTLMTSLGMAEDESGNIRQQQGAAAAVLQRWVGLPADELAAPVLGPPPTSTEFIGNHPAVVARQRDIDVARKEATVAATNRKPNWTWEISYGQRTGYSDMVSLGVSLPLTVAPEARQERETAARVALADKAEAELAEAQRAAQAEYAALTNDAVRLQERIERFRVGVITPAQQRTAATMAAYRSNQASLAGLFEARQAEVDLQRRLLTLQRDLARARAQLSFKSITGGAP